MTNIQSTRCVFSPSAQTSIIQSQVDNRPPSTVPSDDEFIENMISNNLCAKQLMVSYKPISIPSSTPSSPGQDMSGNFGSNTKPPKRRSSKYDAQMRYQTSRIN